MNMIEFIKYCQNIIEQVKKNAWRLNKLTKEDINKDVLLLAKETNTSPMMVFRQKLKLLGFSKKSIKQILFNDVEKIPPFLKNDFLVAVYNDPVFSPFGMKFFDKLGIDGENIIKEWLQYEGIKFKMDPRNGRLSIPDFLLEKPIIIFNHKIKWIESKCSYGDISTYNNHKSQFSKFDNLYGNNGCIVYWFGFVDEIKDDIHLFLSYKDILELVPKFLHPKIFDLINDVPEEFEYFFAP